MYLDTISWLDACLGAATLGLIPALIARSKGRDFLLWWIFGAALFIVALPASIIANPAVEKGVTKKCPHCAEIIKNEANVCRYCGRGVTEMGNGEPAPSVLPNKRKPQAENLQVINCPQCNIPMKVAKAIKGEFVGKDFYVCPNYQQCKQHWPVDRH